MLQMELFLSAVFFSEGQPWYFHQSQQNYAYTVLPLCFIEQVDDYLSSTVITDRIHSQRLVQ